ncbi:MAG: serine/threonine-protein kinase [Polyangiales bacterium]
MSEQSTTEGALEAGEILANKYRVARRIGRGGMGAVYEAEHLITGRRVAVKVLLDRYAKDPAIVARFLREARAAGTIGHPNAIEVLDVLTVDARPVMVMELLDGEDLGSKLARERRLSIAEMARLMIPVLDAVGAAHSKGIVHRDLKPDNIFLAHRGEQIVPKVLDFGIAKVNEQGTSPDSLKLTGTGVMLGTPVYMSPEQASGRTDVDARSDLWALGVICFECLAGRPPFLGDNFGQLFAAILQDDPPSLATLAPECPESVRAMIERCLRKRASERPESVAPLRSLLAEFTDAPTPSVVPVQRPSFASAVESAETLAGTIEPRPAAISGVEATILASTTAPTSKSVSTSTVAQRRSLTAPLAGVAFAAIVAVAAIARLSARTPAENHAAQRSPAELVVDSGVAIAPIDRAPNTGLVQHIDDSHEHSAETDSGALAASDEPDAQTALAASRTNSVARRGRADRQTANTTNTASVSVTAQSPRSADSGVARAGSGLLTTM